MKKIAAILSITAVLVLFAGCTGAEEAQGLVQDGDTMETDVIDDGEEDDSLSSNKLKKEIERHIALDEYGKAVSLAEENIETVNADSQKFESALDDIFIHFSQIAKRYYTHTATYVTKQEVMGYDFDTGIEGYDPETGTIDPHAFEELLSNDERVALERVQIKVTNTDLNYFDFKVSIEICGMTAVYPPEDEMLK
ncbi:MAG: hypothetical protein J5997_03650 [Oscillospiraceae bacterium]|nr:hypothetical protein [Oscillospiraceae bacterium]